MNELDSMCGISDEELVEGRKCKNIDCGCGKKLLSIYEDLCENDKKSVMALLEEMKRHVN